jgi:hypothetical protein
MNPEKEKYEEEKGDSRHPRRLKFIHAINMINISPAMGWYSY